MPLVLPHPQGPYAVGVGSFALEDQNRPDPLSGGAPRRLILEVHYPAAPTAARAAPTVPERVQITAFLNRHGWQDDEGKRLADLYGPAPSHSVAGAAFAEDAAPAPLLFFSPGGYQSRHHYTYFAETIAAQGYAVALMSHPFAGLDYFEGAGLIGRHRDWIVPQGLAGDARDAFLERMIATLALDARFALDQMHLLSGDLAIAFAGKLDFERVGIAGHSRGGKTVGRALIDDARFKAGLILDNLPSRSERERGFERPMALLIGIDDLPDHWSKPDAPRRWEETKRAIAHDMAARFPALRVSELAGVGHMNFSDRALFEPARFRGSLGAKPAFDLVMRNVLAFLDLRLMRLPSAYSV